MRGLRSLRKRFQATVRQRLQNDRSQAFRPGAQRAIVRVALDASGCVSGEAIQTAIAAVELEGRLGARGQVCGDPAVILVVALTA
jgi:hypothetical protein